MEQLLPLPLIEAPVSAKLSVLRPCTPRAGDGGPSGSRAPPCGSKEGLPAEEGGEPVRTETTRKRARSPLAAAAAAAAAAVHAGPAAAVRLGGFIKRKLLIGGCSAAAAARLVETPHRSLQAAASQQQQQQQQRSVHTLAARFGNKRGSFHLDAEGPLGPRETPGSPGEACPPTSASKDPEASKSWEDFASSPFASLKSAVFRCLQDLRAKGGEGAASGGGPSARGPGCFSSHVLNILDACELADLGPYLEIFSVCLRQGPLPRCLSAAARGLMLEALEALEASGFSVHVRAVCRQLSRVVRTLRRRDTLFPPSTLSCNGPLPSSSSCGLSSSCTCSSSGSSGNSSSRSCCSGRGGPEPLPRPAAAGGREDAELADLWVNASLDDPEAEADTRGRPHAEVCRGIDRSHEYLLRCKLKILRQLRALRRLAPVWASRERAYEYHLDAVVAARSPAELWCYLVIFSSLQSDPDGKYPVSVSSLLGCLRELRLLQCGELQETAASTLPVTQAELTQCLAASSTKRMCEAAAGGGGHHGPRKHASRSASAASLPALATRGQKHRLLSPQLDAEVNLNLQRLEAAKARGLLSGSCCFAPAAAVSSAGPPRERADGSLLYAEELMAVAAGVDPEQKHPTAAQQAALSELQRLLRYWDEGVLPAAAEQEAPDTPPVEPAPHPAVSVACGPLKQPPLWKLTRTRSSPPYASGAAAAAAAAAAADSSTRAAAGPVAAAEPYAEKGLLEGNSLLLQRLQHKPAAFARPLHAHLWRGRHHRQTLLLQPASLRRRFVEQLTLLLPLTEAGCCCAARVQGAPSCIEAELLQASGGAQQLPYCCRQTRQQRCCWQQQSLHFASSASPGCLLKLQGSFMAEAIWLVVGERLLRLCSTCGLAGIKGLRRLPRMKEGMMQQPFAVAAAADTVVVACTRLFASALKRMLAARTTRAAACRDSSSPSSSRWLQLS
ncbi:hypothetical protein Efla_005452 [Eimeria flavescens]